MISDQIGRINRITLNVGCQQRKSQNIRDNEKGHT